MVTWCYFSCVEVDKRVFDLFCFYLFPPIILTVIQKMQGHSLSAHVTSKCSRAGRDKLIVIKQIGELSLFN